MHPEVDLSAILSPADQLVITRAAFLAHAGRHIEAEVVRFAAGYHNLKEGIHPEPDPTA